MRIVIAFILAWLLSVQIALQAGSVINYALNKEAITDLFCVNKDKPQMQCNGQCHLMKELKKAETPVDNPSEDSKFPSFKLSEFIVDQFPTIKLQTFTPLLDHQSKLISSQPIQVSFGIFHPPRQA